MRKAVQDLADDLLALYAARANAQGHAFADDTPWQAEMEASFPYEETILGKGPRGADFYDQPDGEMPHLQNWMDSIRSRKPAVATVEAGVISASSAHLANIALRTGQSAQWPGESGFTPLFDGISLRGWEVDTSGLWSVRHGMIVGKHNGLKYNDFLRTKRSYRDFELRLQFRLSGGRHERSRYQDGVETGKSCLQLLHGAARGLQHRIPVAAAADDGQHHGAAGRQPVPLAQSARIHVAFHYLHVAVDHRCTYRE